MMAGTFRHDGLPGTGGIGRAYGMTDVPSIGGVHLSDVDTATVTAGHARPYGMKGDGPLPTVTRP